MSPNLEPCPKCACHVSASEVACPLCSAPLARSRGASLPLTAAAIAMGLVAAGGWVSACSGADYGVGPTSGGGGDTTAQGSGGEGGTGGASPTTASGTGGTGGEGGSE